MSNWYKFAFWSITFVFVVGCGGSTGGVRTEYGLSSGVAGRSSVNGFGALRSAYEQSGFVTRDVFRLNTRTNRSDVIVWTPQVLNPIPNNVTRWLERWLKQGKRTLVYVVPDSGSEADYWLEARASAPPKQRMEYRRRLAKKINERFRWQSNRVELSTNGWFRLLPNVQSWKTVQSLSSGAGQSTVDQSEQDEMQTTEFVLQPFDRETKNAVPNANASSLGPTGPASQYTSYWDVDVSNTKVGFKPLRSTGTEDAVVAELTSGKWKDSKVIVVAGGSMLTNFAMTREQNVLIVNELVESCLDTSQKSKPYAGFLTSNHSPIPISEQASKQSLVSGMEFLTVWPLSLLTIHATLLGFVVCMILFPIFGRARTIQRGSQSDFGDHLDAVASLMSKSRGEHYARRRISEYMRRMKGETSGKWVLEQPKAKPATSQTTPDAQSQSTQNQTTF